MKTEIKVGVFVFVSFLLILASIAYLGKSSFSSEGREYQLTFRFLNDLKPGANVKFAGGILVGYVKDIRPEPPLVKVTIWIKKDFDIRTNSQFFIMGEGFLGEKYININFKEDYEGELLPLAEGSTVQGVDAVSFGEVLKNIYVLTSKVSETVDNINFLLGGMTRRKDIERISRQAVKLLQDTSRIIDENKETVSALLKNSLEGIKTFNTLLNKEMPRLLRSTNQSLFGVTRDITELISELRGLLENIKKGEGVMGKILVDRPLAKEMEQTIINLKKLSEILLTHPLLSPPEGKVDGKFQWRQR